MAWNTILFDLDGTLTDPAEGITKAVEAALNHYGITVADRAALHKFIGPPLDESFPEFYGFDAARTAEATEVFRAYFDRQGWRENIPYPGVEDMLRDLRAAGKRLLVATSKPEVTALEIMEKFQLSPYFEKICGATLDGRRDSKSSVIAYLLNTCTGISQAVMVGDTAFDVLGAAEHRIPTIGVAWGYGNVTEMQESGAVSIANTPQELLELLEK